VLFNPAVLVVFAASTVAASALIIGTQPLTGLTGQVIASGAALRLVIAAWATAVAPGSPPWRCCCRSRPATRRSASPPRLCWVSSCSCSAASAASTCCARLLLTTPFECWHGLLTQHRFYGPLSTGLVVSAAWTVICLTLAYVSVRRRDITGG
jgi:ABC-2 type transport system permease protein